MNQRATFAIVLIVVVAFATSAIAGTGKKCSFAGTWYGGSDNAKYLMTVVPKGGNSYSVTFEGAYSLGG